MGTDPNFTGSSQRNAISVTPGNFPRVCDRFGIMCSTDAAEQIFDGHGVPKDGCSVYKLSKSFIDSKVDIPTIVRQQTRLMHGDSARPTAATRPKTPVRVHDPYKYAHLPSAAWSEHAASRASSAGGDGVSGRPAAGSRSGGAGGGAAAG